MTGTRTTRTYEILSVTGVDDERLTISYRHAAAYQPVTVRLDAPRMPASRQLLHAMAESVTVHQDADARSAWQSSKTLDNLLGTAKGVCARLVARGFDDFADERLDMAVLRDLYEPLSSSHRRSMCTLLARVVEGCHPRGRQLATALRATRFIVDETNPHVYDDETAKAIERAARDVLIERWTGQREALRALGVDVSGRDWMKLPAQAVLDLAAERWPVSCLPEAQQPMLIRDQGERVAWALSHPEKFGRPGRVHSVVGGQMVELGRALYPDRVTLLAGLIVHCLGDDAGPNLSTLLETNAASLVPLGPDHALEVMVKARNSTVDTRATTTESLFSAGGAVQALTGLTRFSRYYRRNLTDKQGRPHAVVDRLYVEHRPVPAQAHVLDDAERHHAWRKNAVFDRHWPAGAPPREQVPLWMNALRKFALRRAVAADPSADVHGHGPRMRVHYLAHVLPDHHTLYEAAGEVQDAMHDATVALFAPGGPLNPRAGAAEGAGALPGPVLLPSPAVRPSGVDSTGIGGAAAARAVAGLPVGQDPAGSLAAVDQERLMDVAVGVCVNDGDDPDRPGRPCGYGITACFVCPNGYRTADHIPGLLAAVELAGIIERNDPVEYAQGEASRLGFYAEQTLARFPGPLVDQVRRTVDLVPYILVVTGMYMELRNG